MAPHFAATDPHAAWPPDPAKLAPSFAATDKLGSLLRLPSRKHWDETTGKPYPCNWKDLRDLWIQAGLSDELILDREWSPRDAANVILAKLKTSKRRGAPKKRRRQFTLGKPLTEKQRQAMDVVAQCKGNISEAARLLQVNPKTVRQHYKAGMAKLGEQVAKGKKPKTQRLPIDRRGQVNLARDGDEQQ